MERFDVMERQIGDPKEIWEIMHSEIDKEKVKNILLEAQIAGRDYLDKDI